MNNLLSVEDQLVAQLTEIEAKIVELEAERRAVQRMIVTARRQGADAEPALRKNSAQRVIIETKILDFLRRFRKPATSALILNAVKQDHRSLNAATFRSYLHRMHQRGLISRSDEKGRWRLPSQS